MPLIEMKTVTITEKGQIAIPKDLRKRSGFKEGTKVVILAFKNRIELMPLEEYYERMYPAIMSEKALAKDWLSEADEKAWKKYQKVT